MTMAEPHVRIAGPVGTYRRRYAPSPGQRIDWWHEARALRLEGKSWKEIAAQLGVSIPRAKHRYYRACQHRLYGAPMPPPPLSLDELVQLATPYRLPLLFTLFPPEGDT